MSEGVTLVGLAFTLMQISFGTLIQLGCWINLESTDVNIHSACNHHHHHHNHHHYHVAIMTSTLVQGQSPSCNPLLARGHTPRRGCSAQAGELRLGKPGQIYGFTNRSRKSSSAFQRLILLIYTNYSNVIHQ